MVAGMLMSRLVVGVQIFMQSFVMGVLAGEVSLLRKFC